MPLLNTRQDKNMENTILELSKPSFEELYYTVRGKEGRIYADEQVARLPEIDLIHPFYHEWKIRSRSSRRLLTYLAKKGRPIRILEVGCGNGWLSSKLAGLPGADVTGIDPHRAEIEQAQRVFHRPNLRFSCEGFTPGGGDFDVVVFAASFQYFASAADTLSNALTRLRPNGEVHLLDTHFYSGQAAEQSALRSKRYFSDIGMAQMARHYFHHRLSDFEGFPIRILFNPANLWNRLTRKDPFFWISLSK